MVVFTHSIWIFSLIAICDTPWSAALNMFKYTFAIWPLQSFDLWLPFKSTLMNLRLTSTFNMRSLAPIPISWDVKNGFVFVNCACNAWLPTSEVCVNFTLLFLLFTWRKYKRGLWREQKQMFCFLEQQAHFVTSMQFIFVVNNHILPFILGK